MKLAFLLLIHRYPEQAIRLIRFLLKDPDSTLFIHVDKKSEEVYQILKSEFVNEQRIIFTSKRFRVYWGSYNQIRATLHLIETANAQGKYEYHTLLSGQDLPIKPIASFKKYLEVHRGTEFMMNFKLPSPANWGGNGGLDRLHYYWIDALIPKYSYTFGKINGLIHRAQNILDYKRKVPFDLYGGANWFTLSGNAITYIVTHLKNNPSFIRHFKFSRCADEMVVQTLILNSPLKEKMVNDDLRFVDWATGPEFPKILRASDEERMDRAETKFFGRKFDPKVDNSIIETIYKKIE